MNRSEVAKKVKGNVTSRANSVLRLLYDHPEIAAPFTTLSGPPTEGTFNLNLTDPLILSVLSPLGDRLAPMLTRAIGGCAYRVACAATYDESGMTSVSDHEAATARLLAGNADTKSQRDIYCRTIMRAVVILAKYAHAIDPVDAADVTLWMARNRGLVWGE